MLSTIMEALKTDPVPLGASQIPAHKPSRRCVASVKVRPCASQRGTRHERDATHGGDRGPAMPIAPTAHARDRTRGGVRGGLRISGRCRRVVVGGAFRTFRNGPKCRDRSKTKRALFRNAANGDPKT